MNDKYEKVCKGIEICMGNYACITCPYYQYTEDCSERLGRETLELLRELREKQ